MSEALFYYIISGLLLLVFWLTFVQCFKYNQKNNSEAYNYKAVSSIMTAVYLCNLIIVITAFIVLGDRAASFILYYSFCTPLLNSLLVFRALGRDAKPRLLCRTKKKEHRLNEKMYAFIKRSDDICIFEYNTDNDEFWITDSIFLMFSLENEPMNKVYCKEVILANVKDGMTEAVFSFTQRNTDEEKWFRINYSNEGSVVVGSIIDVTKEENEKKSVENNYKIDMLTGLLSRRELETVLDNAVSVTNKNKYVAFYYIDIDYFKKINDSYGHAVGDDVLRRFGKAILVPGINASYIRVAGDEFAIIISNVESEEQAIEYGKIHLRSVTNAEFKANEEELTVTFSCGCALLGKDTVNKHEIMKYADFALYEAKQTGRNNITMFNLKNYQKQNKQSRVMMNIDKVINQKRFNILYQPIISVKTGDIVGYESFCKPSQDLDMNILEFLDIINRMNRMAEFDKAIYEIIISDTSVHKEILNSKYIAVNKNHDFISDFTGGDIQGPKLIYEISEYSKDNIEMAKAHIKNIRNRGHDVFIDNYCADFTNDLLILESEIKVIKLDETITKNISKNKHKQLLLRNTVRYAHSVGVEVIAKSVENKEDMHILINIGVDYLQGYYIMEPSMTFREDTPEYIKKEVLNASIAKNRLTGDNS